MSRMRARILFLKEEQAARSRADIVFLDTDMLVLRPLRNVFLRRFDVAATWREDPNQPVNGGIIFVRSSSMGKGQQFFENMLAITMGSLDVMRRWFGTSDQASVPKGRGSFDMMMAGELAPVRTLHSKQEVVRMIFLLDRMHAAEVDLSNGQGDPSAGARL